MFVLALVDIYWIFNNLSKRWKKLFFLLNGWHSMHILTLRHHTTHLGDIHKLLHDPLPLCHSKMGLLITNSFKVSLKWQALCLYLHDVFYERPLHYSLYYIFYSFFKTEKRFPEVYKSSRYLFNCKKVLLIRTSKYSLWR